MSEGLWIPSIKNIIVTMGLQKQPCFLQLQSAQHSISSKQIRSLRSTSNQERLILQSNTESIRMAVNMIVNKKESNREITKLPYRRVIYQNKQQVNEIHNPMRNAPLEHHLDKQDIA